MTVWGFLDIAEMAEKLKRHECVSIFKQYKFYESGAIVKEDDGEGVARGNTYLTFLMPVAGKEKQSWEISPRWGQFMQQGAKKVRLTIAPPNIQKLIEQELIEIEEIVN